MTDFDYEVLQKKRISYGARNRVCGSKSRKCSLPSDTLTKKQWKERNSQVVTCNFSKPMNWVDFCKLPIHIQKEYLLYLIERYNVSARDISKMMGISPSYFSRHCTKNDFGIKFLSKKVPEENSKMFQAFCNGEAPTDEPEPEPEQILAKEESQSESEPDPKANPVELTQIRQASMQMKEFFITFDGPFDASMVYNSLACILDRGSDATLEIRCSVK